MIMNVIYYYLFAKVLHFNKIYLFERIYSNIIIILLISNLQILDKSKSKNQGYNILRIVKKNNSSQNFSWRIFIRF